MTSAAPSSTAALPFIDEHAILVAASPEAAWDAARRVLGGLATSSAARAYGRLVRADPAFAITEEVRPRRLVLQGRHAFSRYAIVVHVEPAAAGARVRLESRAVFPGPHGALYRLAVVGSRGHVVAVRRLLAQVRRAAERGG